MADSDTQQSIWNFDGAELYLIFGIKQQVVEYLEAWDMEGAYRKVRLLRMELDAKLKREAKKILKDFEDQKDEAKTSEKRKQKKTKKKTEKEVVDAMMIALDNKFTEWKADEDDDEIKEALYKEIERFYMHLCHLMKKHGLYFREGEDMTLAVLRR